MIAPGRKKMGKQNDRQNDRAWAGKNEKTKMIAQNDRAPKWSRIIFSRLCLANPSIMIDHFGGDCLYPTQSQVTQGTAYQPENHFGRIPRKTCLHLSLRR